jgi:hypothetical protein
VRGKTRAREGGELGREGGREGGGEGCYLLILDFSKHQSPHIFGANIGRNEASETLLLNETQRAQPAQKGKFLEE